MGFDDLEAAEQSRADRDDESSGGDVEPPETEPDATRSTDADDAASDPAVDGAADSSGSETSDEPAFEYDDVKQAPLYARPEAWAALEDALDLDVVRTLREAGVRNEEKRELHDAVLRVAADHPDEIAEAVQEARRED
ncbi:uncharacterized protein HHUB_2421 [Halobacterium hubeiense]|uniref:Uncharacterized protein n=1 Tax=Halobacterium hubeiense TaxID=1407499 RepID=A0A0U5CYC3_9EURY|nr:hypothetical protein [Halobacterium hubeiense]CQH56715.1 uncharacterized protein HHUB_2421 [Halobacterium hubeiense]